MEVSGLPPEVIEDSLRRMSESPQQSRSTSGRFAVTSLGKVVSFAKSGPGLELGEITDIVDGDLLCTVFNRQNERYVDIERSALYASPYTFGNRLLPWFTGALALNQLFDSHDDSFRTDGSFASQKFKSGEGWHFVVFSSWNENHLPNKITETHGSATSPSIVCEFLSWRMIDPYYVPEQVVITSHHASGDVATSLTLSLVEAEFGHAVGTQLLSSMGPQGEKVMDCRFGNNNCISYEIGDSPLTDEQVKSLLQKKKANKFAPPTQPADWTRIALVISGVALLAASCVVWYVLRKRRG
jgi:hypothetical protein